MAVGVDRSRCPQNHPCPAVRVCPAGALEQTDREAPRVVVEKCTDCGECVAFCPMGALRQVGR